MPPSLHAFTTGGNIVGIAAALKTLEIVTREGFLENVRAMGERMTTGLKQIFAGKNYVKDIRGPGLMIGIEIVDEEGNPSPKRVSCLVNEGYNHRLILRESRYGRGPVLKMRPPLIIDKDEVDMILERLSDTVDAAERHARWSAMDMV
jgi:4-aminobutyrate aminotransferase